MLKDFMPFIQGAKSLREIALPLLLLRVIESVPGIDN